MPDQQISAKLDAKSRITIPARVRDYFEIPDPAEEDVWIQVTIHGKDPLKHPEESELEAPE